MKLRNDESVNHYFKYPYFLASIFALLQSGYWNLIQGASGLDISSMWLLGHGITSNLTQNGEIFNVYGPLGFLDWNILEYRKLIIFPLIYRFILLLIFYNIVFKLVNISTKIARIYIHILTNSVMLLISLIQPPTFMLVVLVIFKSVLGPNKVVKKSYIEYFGFGSLLAILFLIKMIYFALALPWVIYYFYVRSKSPKLGNFYNFIIFGKKQFTFFSGFFITVTVTLLCLGFNFESALIWARSYFEGSKGYVAMAGEEPGRLWEYFAYVFVSIMLLIKKKEKLNIVQLSIVLLAIYISFRYGFIRHDSHSNLSFLYLFVIILIFFIEEYDTYSRNYWIKLQFLIATFLIIVSNLNVLEFLNFTSRMQQTGQYVKLLDTRYRSSIYLSSNQTLINQLGLSGDTLKMFSGKTISVLPWAITPPVETSMSFIYPPQPQLFAAYTDWFDKFNQKWLVSSGPSIILRRPPGTIDNKFSFWESPSFQMEIMCRYSYVKSDAGFDILIRNQENLCDFSKTKLVAEYSNSINFEPKNRSLYFINIKPPLSFPREIAKMLFKPVSHRTVTFDGVAYRLIDNVNNHLLVSSGFDSSITGSWSLFGSHTLSFEPGTKIYVFEVPLKVRS